MAITATETSRSQIAATEVLWYAAYTYPRHEKSVFEQLLQKSVECYLPVYEEMHRWTDRTVRIELPLFPGYVFVHIPLSERRKVLNVSSVVRILSFNGHPVPLPESEIANLRKSLAHRRVEPYPRYLCQGDRVRIKTGPLKGLEGIVEHHKGRSRIVISIHAIMNSVAVHLETEDLEPIS